MDDVRRVAVKLAYDGTRFSGYQRQPDRRTVEGCLLSSILKVGAAPSARASALRSSSRTDRGVSALGNIASFKTDFDGSSICPALNSELEDVWVYSGIDVPDDFNPRWARQRWYRYNLPRGRQDIGVMRDLAGRFVGEYDFSRFARNDGRDPVRVVDSVAVAESGPFIVIDIRAESFLWNMVRRIVWMLDAAGRGEVDASCVGPEASSMPRRIGLAPPEHLTLMDVDCGLAFPVDPRARKAVAAEMGRRAIEGAAMQEFSTRLLKAVGADDAGGSHT